MKKLILNTIIGLGSIGAVSAQSLAPEAFVSGGGEFNQSTASLSFTLGESMVETYSSADHFLTNGFQQSMLSVQEGDVWPGDANLDGAANVWDILPIGLAYGSTGPARPNASIEWEAQVADSWGSILIFGNDVKHIDCDGDGTVDSDDIIPTLANYGKTHNRSTNTKGGPDDPRIYVDITQDELFLGDTVDANIYLGTPAKRVSNAYGIAYRINYDPKYIVDGSMELNSEGSWLGTDGTDMMKASKELSDDGYFDVGFSRIDYKNRTGYGKIGAIRAIIEDVIIGREIHRLDISISDVVLISYEGDTILINEDESMDTIAIIDGFTTVNADAAAPSKDFELYPNPANNFVNITNYATGNTSLSLYNEMGQLVYHFEDSFRKHLIDLSDLPNGLYVVRLQSEKGQLSKRFVIAD